MDNEKLVSQFAQIVAIVGTERNIDWMPHGSEWNVFVGVWYFSGRYESFPAFIEALKSAVGHKKIY